MKDKLSEVEKWIETGLRDATDELNRGCGTDEGLSDFKRGKLCGIIIGVERAKARMSWLSKREEQYDARNTWVCEIILHTPLTIAAAFEIYDFCDRNDLLKRYNTIEKIIALSLKGHKWRDITNLLKLEALKGGTWIHRGIWVRRSRDE